MDERQFSEVKTTEQSWGKEEVFADLEGRFVGKVLHLRAGEHLDLRLHGLAEDVISLMSGAVVLEIGDDAESISRMAMSPGQSVRIQPGATHRIQATDNSMVLEVSSARPLD